MILTASEKDPKSEWVMDSGCTFHITPDRDVLFDFKEIDGGKVLMGNNTFSEVKGMGKVKIINSEGATVILSDVRYMPTMSRNLISYGQLEKSGCKYEGERLHRYFLQEWSEGDFWEISKWVVLFTGIGGEGRNICSQS